MKAKIFKPAKSAMQSGRAGNKSWKLVLEDGSHQSKDPLIGYYGGSNTSSQINLFFETKEEAVSYAKRHKLNYDVLETSRRKVISKSYADNFK
tara:strand:+ start:377 stop:655 length:279 start_codon:yes stop_codon:yes gene_type:complete